MATVIIGISIPRELLNAIDETRGEVTRSRYITKLLEKAMINNTKKSVSP